MESVINETQIDVVAEGAEAETEAGAETGAEAEVVVDENGRDDPASLENDRKEKERVEEALTPTPTPEITNHNINHIPHDSMVTVRLSEPPTPPALHVDTNSTPREEIKLEEKEIEEEQNPEDKRNVVDEDSPRITLLDPTGNEVQSPSGSESPASQGNSSRRDSESSDDSMEGPGVNWEELEKTEEKEPRNENSDDSTALLLAMLEQENNLLATNPKSGMTKVKIEKEQRQRRQSRPPSMQQLKKMVNGPTPAALRYSMVPPPPMTDLEFYAALVQDYARTAQCLPTLLSRKIRDGIPPPLRGVVWQSMSGARDHILEDHFDRLCDQASPYEGIIGKDLGRSFPGVEMFREPDGDGQRMLGRVLRCFSLYDQKIGYCQGLGFLVGPLLMHMGDKQAFGVLVRLMEHYDLRACFLPDLSGLHVRIYQFQQLLKQHLPKLSKHLEHLQIEPAYVSQWFLSFFAVTCPLPMLFRIYDVVFAEGASETLMRVALSLMRKNEEKITACTEMEDVMHLLLSRGLWDVYHYNADEFVNDFVSMTGIVTRETLSTLETSYKDAQVAGAPSENIGTVAARFLGRIWSPSHSTTKSVNLSPGLPANNRPASFLRRTPSRQSMATLNSIEGNSSDSMLSATTEATSVSRDSSNTDGSSLRGKSVNFGNKEDKNLHGQIEDLLTALSEMQRDHAILANQLQKEREEREEDKTAVRALLDALRKKTTSEVEPSVDEDSLLTVTEPEDKEQTQDTDSETSPANNATADHLSHLLDNVKDRFAPRDNKRSSMLQTKSQLRDDLARSKEQLIIETSRSQDFSRQISEHLQEISSLKDQVKESRMHIRNAHQEKQRLERQIHDFRTKSKTATTPEPEGTYDLEPEWPKRTSGNVGGLRELRLGRTNSTKSQKVPVFSKRTSSLIMGQILNKENRDPNFSRPGNITPPVNEETFVDQTPVNQAPTQPEIDSDALLLELVQAKTAEAVAKQEAEEYKAKLESLKKMMSGNGNDLVKGHQSTPSQASVQNTTPPAATAIGSFWGGWGKRSASTPATAE